MQGLAIGTLMLLGTPGDRLGLPQPHAAPGLVRAAIANPDFHCKLAAQFLATRVPKADWPYLRFLSYANLERDRAAAERQRRVNAWWVNNMSFEGYPELPRPVPGADGLLYSIDLRDYRWTAAGWAAVAQREPYTQEPWVEHEHAKFLRAAIGYELPEALVKKGLFPVVAVVRADFLFRDTIETDRSTSYYDLLFSRQRFGGGTKTVKRVVEHQGGDYQHPNGGTVPNLAPGRYEIELAEAGTAAFVDFPRDEDDWNVAFGIDKTVAFLKQEKLNLQLGAIAPGSADDPKHGSIVARNNRVVQITPLPTGGVALKTFDAKETAGTRDYLENSVDVAVGKITFDAGELLAHLPNGGQAGLLVDAKGKRLELAATTFAHNKLDPRYVDVRTMMGCVTCHGPDSGFIVGRNLVEEVLAAGIDTRIKDRGKLLAFKAFFLEWEHRVRGFREPYTRLIERTTKADPLDKASKPYKPVELTREFLACRDRYDDPVTAERAAEELGVPPLVLKLVAVRSPLIRLSELVQGRAIPRRTWESTIYREAALALVAARRPRPTSPEYRQ